MDTDFREGQALRGPNPAHSEFATRPLDTLPTVRLSETATNVQTLLAKRVGSVREVSYAWPPEPAVGPTRRVPSGRWHTEPGGGAGSLGRRSIL